jgi:hypothetical protein
LVDINLAEEFFAKESRTKQTPYKKTSRKYRPGQTISIPDNGDLCELQNASFEPVSWIRIGFIADPDPALYLNADPGTDPNPGKQTNADPG